MTDLERAAYWAKEAQREASAVGGNSNRVHALAALAQVFVSLHLAAPYQPGIACDQPGCPIRGGHGHPGVS